MCLATVYVEHQGGREEVMREVAWVQPEDGGLRLFSLMGQSRIVQAEIMSIDLLHSTIVLRSRTAEPGQGTPPEPE